MILYFKDVQNWVDLIGLGLTATITLITLIESQRLSMEVLRIMASFASCLLIIKVYDWLRIFENTAFYIKLVEHTLKDIKSFLILIVVALCAFGLPMSLLDLNESKDEDHHIDPAFDLWIIDAIYGQYLIALGEFAKFEITGQRANHDILILVFFNAATFFTQITMLNMLIAIMGNSYAKASENREKFAIKTKLDILSTQAPSLP